jgi:methylated-DNA-protein-cysteine methyltransferase-like protein
VSFKSAVLALVARIPRGRVATYGQVAALVGKPRSARAVGQVVSRAEGVPWHRVVNSQGGISRRPRMTGMLTQKIRLEQEGVVFRRGRVVMSRFRWQGGAAGRRVAAAQAVAGPGARRPQRASGPRGFACDSR